MSEIKFKDHGMGALCVEVDDEIRGWLVKSKNTGQWFLQVSNEGRLIPHDCIKAIDSKLDELNVIS